MCGLFGQVGVLNSEQLLQLALAAKERGALGIGYTVKDVLAKYAGFPAELSFPSGRGILLGHTLAPTNGDPITLPRVQPYQIGSLMMAHNGIVNNAVMPAKRKEGLPNVDSAAMLANVYEMWMGSNMTLQEAIRENAEMWEGQFACWAHEMQSSMVYLWRCMSPIFYREHGDTLSFSSVNVPGVADILIPEGIVFRVNINSASLQRGPTFKYTSIYHV